MSAHDLSAWTHPHRFDRTNLHAERSTQWVMWITLAAMTIEIAAGNWFNSMALLADGWHMSSHAVAIGLSAFAYAAARRYAKDASFVFGTWKIEVLAGFTSAIFLLGVAATMVFGSVERLLTPQTIHYREAIAVAVLGLAVNLICALILGDADHAHDAHDHDREHKHDHGHDLNLKAAYLHVVADAATSVLAIVGLLGGWFYGWAWLDPAMGIVGAVLIAVWAKNLLIQTAWGLLDRELDGRLAGEIRRTIATQLIGGASEITDLHVWRVGKGAHACILSILTHDTTLTPQHVKKHLGRHGEIVHATIEIQLCTDCR